jgi:hypothetical protein
VRRPYKNHSDNVSSALTSHTIGVGHQLVMEPTTIVTTTVSQRIYISKEPRPRTFAAMLLYNLPRPLISDRINNYSDDDPQSVDLHLSLNSS